MLAAERPQVVMIGSPNHLHLGQLRAARHRRHLASFGGKTFVPESRPERHEHDRMAAEVLVAEGERIHPFKPGWACGNSDFESGDIVDYQTALVKY